MSALKMLFKKLAQALLAALVGAVSGALVITAGYLLVIGAYQACTALDRFVASYELEAFGQTLTWFIIGGAALGFFGTLLFSDGKDDGDF